ncbi:hypothetical protein CCO03_08730 [Comamonas serinivorans]|uniref:Phage gp6-like head-tail connector protein n=1 Tax=Comamonas serinivorans TaxID=1082851 RepID=A0A1Y0EMU0_9BURK|nr:head-tail connector protein [Comamonas serinivorans]ARU04750.1 hypothetical protein CCO03_08730 [Comamonas serinivorans]
MNLVTLEQAKEHLRVDGNDEDDLIQLKLDAAHEQAVQYLNRSVYDTQAEVDAAVDEDRPMVVNASVKTAILLTLGHLYANRETADIPDGARALLTPWRIHWGV